MPDLPQVSTDKRGGSAVADGKAFKRRSATGARCFLQTSSTEVAFESKRIGGSGAELANALQAILIATSAAERWTHQGDPDQAQLALLHIREGVHRIPR